MRRTGDKIQIAGDYQLKALHQGKRPQRIWHKNRMETIKGMLSEVHGQKVLDAGCGSGVLCEFIVKELECSYLGIDSNQEAVEFCKDAYTFQEAEFRLGLLDELVLDKNNFTVIIFSEVIEHLTKNQAEKIIKLFFNSLKPGGLLIISTPNKKSTYPLIEWILDYFKLVPDLGKDQHEYTYSPAELKHMVKKIGFELAEERYINLLSPWLSILSFHVASFIHNIGKKVNLPICPLMIMKFAKPT